MPKLTIDGIEIEVPAGTTVLQAAEKLGIEIPRFCYHDKLSVSGNCRMCLVDIEKQPKLAASCAMPVGEGMVVHTNNQKVKDARKGVMEFLLINHPLDCPICDQAGECDLQDQALHYGCDKGRYQEEKRVQEDHDYGPVIKTIMTRCIQCTRCVRFAAQVAGVPVLGGFFRGDHMEIGTYVHATLNSELSGCLADVCPVGALTLKPYAFKARPWELKKFESIDVMDALGSNIRVDVKGAEVLRIQPRLNDYINEEWLGDKSRLVMDAFKVNRLDTPWLKKNGKLEKVSWDEALKAAGDKLKAAGGKIAALAGDYACAESMLALKDLLAGLGSAAVDCRQDGLKIDNQARAGYLFNSSILGIEEADVILLVGSNPRKEAPVLNARIRKRYLKGGLRVASIGQAYDLSYKCENLGEKAGVLAEIASGKHPFAEVLKNAKKPMLILGQGALTRADGAAIWAKARELAEACGLIKDGWNGFNVLHSKAGVVTGLEVGFVGKSDPAQAQVVYLLGADEIATASLKNAFVIYQGHNGDKGAAAADLILPAAAYTEKSATYVNTEGRAQRTRQAVFPPGEAKEDWRIIRALADYAGVRLGYDDVKTLRQKLAGIAPSFAQIDELVPASWAAFGQAGAIEDTVLKSSVENYYQTCVLSRASQNLANCAQAFTSENKGA